MEYPKSSLYQEEYKYILSKKAYSVRGASVTSAFVEGQILQIATSFLQNHGVKYEPTQSQEYRQSLAVLAANRLLNKSELKSLEDFRKERNKSIHGPFKGMTRNQWEKQNNKVVKLGRLIILALDKKLYPLI